MIELTPLARPYAKALFASALESGDLDNMADELKIMAIASESKEVIGTIENPVLSRQEVVDILVNLFADSITDTSKKLLSILADNKATWTSGDPVSFSVRANLETISFLFDVLNANFFSYFNN